MLYKSNIYTLKDAYDIANLLADNGVKKIRQRVYICPFCGSGTGKNRTAAFSTFTGNDLKGRFKCFSCNKSGDYYDLYSLLTGQKYSENPNAVLDYKPPIKPPEKTIQSLYKPPSWYIVRQANIALLTDETKTQSKAISYLAGRGIDELLIREFFIGLLFDERQRPYILLPCVGKDYYISGTQNRFFNGETPKQKQPKGQTGLKIWNEKAFNDEKPILIFEGIIDALTAYKIKEFKQFNAIAINGTSYVHKLISYLQANKPKNRLFACFDNDKAGDYATACIKQAFPKMETLNGFYSNFKDLNDFYTKEYLK